jgi:hypothetical protein
MSDWLETLTAGTVELTLPTLVMARGAAVRFKGSGRLHWQPDSRVRVLAETDGAAELLQDFGRAGPALGQLLPESEYVSVRGQTQDGWEVSTERVPLAGYHVDFGSPYVTWDFVSPSVSLTRARAHPGKRRLLRGLMGPPPRAWTRITETEVRNEHFGTQSYRRDWLLSTTQFGQVAARQRSEQWFEVRISIEGAQRSLDSLDILSAIRDAFSFLLGRRLLMRGFEHILPDREVRYLTASEGELTRSSLLMPLGSGSPYLDHVEALLGQAIDFFITAHGRTMAQHLALCWDTADNHLPTRLAVASICVEALLRLASQGGAGDDRGYTDADQAAITAWIAAQQSCLSPRFAARVRGFVAALNHKRPVDILWDWQRRGFLAVTADDIEAWESIRHPATHGGLAAGAPSQNQLQTRLNAFHRVLNLINRVALQLMGYEGVYVDYAQPGWPETHFPPAAPTS